jgi:hypothetical protein
VQHDARHLVLLFGVEPDGKAITLHQDGRCLTLNRSPNLEAHILRCGWSWLSLVRRSETTFVDLCAVSRLIEPGGWSRRPTRKYTAVPAHDERVQRPCSTASSTALRSSCSRARPT